MLEVQQKKPSIYSFQENSLGHKTKVSVYAGVALQVVYDKTDKLKYYTTLKGQIAMRV